MVNNAYESHSITLSLKSHIYRSADLCSATLTQRFTSTWLYRGWIIMMFQRKINIHSQSRQSEAVTAGGKENKPYLTAAADVVTPVLGRTFVTSFSHSVGWTDTLTCVSVTVISHMGTLACCETDRNREQVNCGAQLSTCSKCQRRLLLCCGNISVIAWQKTLRLEGDGQIYTPSRQRITLFLMKWTPPMKTVALTGQAFWHPHSGTELESKSHCLISDWLAHNLLLIDRAVPCFTYICYASFTVVSSISAVKQL